MLAELPTLPTDNNGPVFREPWEAQAFALVVALHQAGHFTWPEWVATISAEIHRPTAAGPSGSDLDAGQTYYHHWLAALETILVTKGLAHGVDLQLRRLECAANANIGHGHVAKREPVRVA